MASCCAPNSSIPENVCINASKIFDQCRLQVCLTAENIGPARVYSGSSPCVCGENSHGRPSPVVVPPPNSVSVTVRDLCIQNISVITKEPSKIRSCYWDVTVKFTFVYTLKFYDADSCDAGCTKAYSTYTTTVSLFGGDDINTAVFNELLGGLNCNGPFVAAEGSAVALAASLHYRGGRNGGCYVCCPAECRNVCAQSCGCTNNDGCGGCGCGGSNGGGNMPPMRPEPEFVSPTGVDVTIGLFAVIKLLRMSNICVESCGNCTPSQCTTTEGAGIDPCDFFNSLQFPTDLFAPQTNYVPSSDIDSDTPAKGGCC